MPEALLAVGERWRRLKRGGDARTRARSAIVVTFAIAPFGLAGSVAPPTSAQPTPPQTQQKDAVRPAITPIPVPEIAQRAEQVTPLLRSAKQIAADSDVQDIEAQLSAVGEWLRGRLVGTRQALASSPSTNALATLTDSWRVMRSKLAAWNDTLTRRAIEREGRDL